MCIFPPSLLLISFLSLAFLSLSFFSILFTFMVFDFFLLFPSSVPKDDDGDDLLSSGSQHIIESMEIVRNRKISIDRERERGEEKNWREKERKGEKLKREREDRERKKERRNWEKER